MLTQRYCSFPSIGMRGTTQIDSLTVTHQEVSGAIAQLGERLPCTQEVVGSIPITSTIFHSKNELSGDWGWKDKICPTLDF